MSKNYMSNRRRNYVWIRQIFIHYSYQNSFILELLQMKLQPCQFQQKKTKNINQVDQKKLQCFKDQKLYLFQNLFVHFIFEEIFHVILNFPIQKTIDRTIIGMKLIKCQYNLRNSYQSLLRQFTMCQQLNKFNDS
ncbi:unnamed protein product [Paramecium sonneborni]|uniref:Uncharacterized protein n=1 Tax=Paramecium sonneborni TaxID=65129 RepID=A0A8S1K5P4_9CILI|nr:unnamed protein product [Paramecium sonneborni]